MVYLILKCVDFAVDCTILILNKHEMMFENCIKDGNTFFLLCWGPTFETTEQDFTIKDDTFFLHDICQSKCIHQVHLY